MPKRSAVHRYEFNGTAAGAYLSEIDALDLAVSPETVTVEPFAKDVFFEGTRPMDGGESSLPLRTQLDANELGTGQLHQDIDQTCIAARRFDALLSAPRCHCDYPQPPDADLITVDVDHSATADEVKRNTTPGSEDVESRPNSKKSASSSSWWQRSKRFVKEFVVYVTCNVCLCC